MWAGVTARFREFHRDLTLTGDQVEDGITKHQGVCQCLNRQYYNSDSETENRLLIGSWSKDTRMRPPRDVDVLFVLPVDVYHRFQTYTGNKQSALLQEVKGVLENTYPSTEMRGDGQVVMVRFNTVNVEVAPGFALQNGQYWICDTNNGGRYKATAPKAEIDHINTIHGANNYNLL
jgi:tRNA nucleotidyltransferase (CCA-adding enzyme)